LRDTDSSAFAAEVKAIGAACEEALGESWAVEVFGYGEAGEA